MGALFQWEARMVIQTESDSSEEGGLHSLACWGLTAAWPMLARGKREGDQLLGGAVSRASGGGPGKEWVSQDGSGEHRVPGGGGGAQGILWWGWEGEAEGPHWWWWEAEEEHRAPTSGGGE